MRGVLSETTTSLCPFGIFRVENVDLLSWAKRPEDIFLHRSGARILVRLRTGVFIIDAASGSRIGRPLEHEGWGFPALSSILMRAEYFPGPVTTMVLRDNYGRMLANGGSADEYVEKIREAKSIADQG